MQQRRWNNVHLKLVTTGTPASVGTRRAGERTCAADVEDRIHTHGAGYVRKPLGPRDKDLVPISRDLVPISRHQAGLQVADSTYLQPILNIAVLQEGLSSHPDRDFVDRIINGAINGVRLGYNGPRYYREFPNWPSATRNAEAVQKIIDSDVAKGRKIGPFLHPPTSTWVGSPLGAFEKKSSPGKFRVISDMSWPPGRSVNEFITEDCSLSYISVDTAVAYIKKLGKNCLLAKLDIQDAFKHISVSPSDIELQGSTWFRKLSNGTYRKEFYMDRVLVFGCRSSPKIFNEYATALEYIMKTKGVTDVCHFLDDYLTAGPADSDTCKNNLKIMRSCCENIGFPVQEKKVAGPTTVLEFLGIVLDTEKSETRISKERLLRTILELKNFRKRKTCTKRQLLSIIGKLSFISQVVRPGRTFTRRLIDLSKRAHYLHHHIKLNGEAKKDMEWWLQYLPSWNGINMFYEEQWSSNKVLHLYTDASDVGYGAVFGEKWFMCKYEDDEKHLVNSNIAWRELHAILVALATWGNLLRGKRLLFHCDNEAVVYVVRKSASKDKDLADLMRKMFFVSAKCNIEISASHIRGSKNTVADSLSRLDLDKFRLLRPSANKIPCLPVKNFNIFV